MSVPQRLTTTVSTKGQVILPKAIRQALHWEAGTRLVVENTPDGVLLKPAPVFAETRPEEVFGRLARDGAPKSLAEMEAGVLAEAQRRHAGASAPGNAGYAPARRARVASASIRPSPAITTP